MALFFTTSYFLLYIFISFLLLLSHRAYANCGLSGCSQGRSFTSHTTCPNDTRPILPPRLVHTFALNSNNNNNRNHNFLNKTVTSNTRSSLGCVGNGGNLICTSWFLNGSSVIDSWRFESSSLSHHYSVFLEQRASLPLVSSTGEVIASDGFTLVGFYSDGKPIGPNIPLTPIQGDIFDLALTDNQVIILLYKLGFIAGYLTDGVPQGSLWLNDTVDGEEGTFLPLSAPAVLQNRAYFVSVFQRQGSDPRYNRHLNPSSSCLLRVYAIDFHRTISDRLEIAWTHDLECPFFLSSQVGAHQAVSLRSEKLLFSVQSEKNGSLSLVIAVSGLNDSLIIGLADIGNSSNLIFAQLGSSFGPQPAPRLFSSFTFCSSRNLLFLWFQNLKSNESEVFALKVSSPSSRGEPLIFSIYKEEIVPVSSLTLLSLLDYPPANNNAYLPEQRQEGFNTSMEILFVGAVGQSGSVKGGSAIASAEGSGFQAVLLGFSILASEEDDKEKSEWHDNPLVLNFTLPVTSGSSPLVGQLATLGNQELGPLLALCSDTDLYVYSLCS